MLENEELPGFSAISFGLEDDNDDVSKKLKSTKKGGGFQAMSLCPAVLKGISKRGYKIPTPIQRKVFWIICVPGTLLFTITLHFRQFL